MNTLEIKSMKSVSLPEKEGRGGLLRYLSFLWYLGSWSSRLLRRLSSKAVEMLCRDLSPLPKVNLDGVLRLMYGVSKFNRDLGLLGLDLDLDLDLE